MQGRGWTTVVLLGLALGSARAEGPIAPALVVKAVGPDRQAEAVLRLFEGSRARSPAAAMAAWRRATGDSNGLPKAMQAAAAAFNPEMVAEWRAFRDAELGAGLGRDGRPHWWAVAPNDDGTLAAMVTSFRLSGGGDEPPLGDPTAAVERLGGPGSALASVTPRGTAFAGRREELAAAVARLGLGDATEPSLQPLAADESSFRLDFDASRLPADVRAAPAFARPLAAARAAGLEAATGLLSLRDDHLDFDLTSRFGPSKVALVDAPPVDPAWLSFFPADATRAAFAASTGSAPAFWDAAFEVADRVDRAEPARAQLQPLRVRLNLLAAVRGVRPEVDLWPLLRGVSAGLVAGPDASGVSLAVVALHAEHPEDAERILTRVARPLSAGVGKVGGRPLETALCGNTVLVGWGEGALKVALASADEPGRSVASIAIGGDRPVSRVAVVRPSLAGPLVGEADSPLAATLAEAEPVVWRGGREGTTTWDLIRWGGLRRSVARFLERVPQEPAEGR